MFITEVTVSGGGVLDCIILKYVSNIPPFFMFVNGAGKSLETVKVMAELLYWTALDFTDVSNNVSVSVSVSFGYCTYNVKEDLAGVDGVQQLTHMVLLMKKST